MGYDDRVLKHRLYLVNFLSQNKLERENEESLEALNRK